MPDTLEHFLPTGQYHPFRNSLELDERDVYDAVVYGALAYKDSIPLASPPSREFLEKLLTFCKLDVPELFFIRGLALERRKLGGSVVRPLYRFDHATAEAHLREMERVASKVLEPLDSCGPDQTLRALHDWLVKHAVFADEDESHSHEAPGALLFGTGVCEGVTKALKYLCDRAGIRTMVAVGRASDARGGERGPHAWNIVEFEGRRWRHVDVAYDAGLSSSTVRYDYFGLSDEEIAVDHELNSAWPSCPDSLGYYRAAGRFAATRGDLERIARTAAAHGEEPFVFQLPRLREGDAQRTPRAVSALLAEALTGPIALSYNPHRMVFQAERVATASKPIPLPRASSRTRIAPAASL